MAEQKLVLLEPIIIINQEDKKLRRLNKEEFVKLKRMESVYGVQIQKGNLYIKCGIEKWEECSKKEPYRVELFTGIRQRIINHGRILCGTSGTEDCLEAASEDVREREGYMGYAYEDIKDRKKYRSVYDCMLAFMEPIDRSCPKGDYDYDIFIIGSQEFENCWHMFKDGEYIFIISADENLSEEEVEGILTVEEIINNARDTIDSLMSIVGDFIQDGVDLTEEEQVCEDAKQDIENLSNLYETIMLSLKAATLAGRNEIRGKIFGFGYEGDRCCEEYLRIGQSLCGIWGEDGYYNILAEEFLKKFPN